MNGNLTDERRADFMEALAFWPNLSYTPEEAAMIEQVGKATEFTCSERLAIDKMILKYKREIQWRI